MNVVLWIVASVLAVAFLLAGAMKLARNRQQLAASGVGWAADFPAGLVKLIGALEVLGAAGLVLPPAFGIAPVLAPVAACGVAALMIGAVATHVRRAEYQMIVVNAVLLIAAAVVAWGRFGPHRFTS